MPAVTAILVFALPALALGVVVGMAMGRRGRGNSPSPSDSPAGAPPGDEGRLRAQALDVAAEPVLILSNDGRVLDCNAAALSLFDRHRPAVTGANASALRALQTSRGNRIEWTSIVAARAPWSGEAHVRLPDGSRQVATVRLVPLFLGAGREPAAVVEVYAEPRLPDPSGADRFLRALDESTPVSDDPGEAARRELHLLALGLADLDRVVRQYELLLPAMRAEEPLAEAIAGLAADTQELIAAADVPRLLRELPRTLERLRAHVREATERATAVSPDARS